MPIHYAALARHGDYEQPDHVPSAWLPYPLTDAGRDQAARLADEILQLASSHDAQLDSSVDSSTLLRAYQTAAIAARGLQQSTGSEFAVAQFDELCERSVGAMANLTIEEIEAILARDPRAEPPPSNWKATSGYRLPVPGAESLRQSGVRVAAHLRARMASVAADSTASKLKLFVGHGASIRHAAVELGVMEQAQIPSLSMYHARPILLAYTPEADFRHVAGAWKPRGKAAARD